MKTFWLALAMVALAPPAQAQMTMTEEMQYCAGPFAEARWLEMWHNLPCQEQGSCEPAHYYQMDVPVTCGHFGYIRCVTDKTLDRASCIAEVSAFVEGQVADVMAQVTQGRIDALRPNAKHFDTRRLDQAERAIGQMPDSEKEELCATYAEPLWPYNGSFPELTCDTVLPFVRLRVLQSSLRSIEAMEARQ